jgi:hypothetical protein
MKKRADRFLFWAGFLLYAISLALPVGSPNEIAASDPSSGAAWALDAFLFPWIYAHWHSWGSFVRDSPITNISVAITGWINPIFIFTILFLLLGKAVRTGEILRYMVLLMIPFSWLALAYQQVYRFRAGYFLWILGMVLSLCFAARQRQLRST